MIKEITYSHGLGNKHLTILEKISFADNIVTILALREDVSRYIDAVTNLIEQGIESYESGNAIMEDVETEFKNKVKQLRSWN